MVDILRDIRDTLKNFDIPLKFKQAIAMKISDNKVIPEEEVADKKYFAWLAAKEIAKSRAYDPNKTIFDAFDEKKVQEIENGKYLVKMTAEKDSWLSFPSHITVTIMINEDNTASYENFKTT